MSPRFIPESYEAIVIPKESQFAVDGADFTCGILEQMMETYFRVAQLGFIMHEDELEIVNLQGSGPAKKYSQYRLDTKKTYNKLRRALNGMKPINALVGVIAMLAKQDSRFRRIICNIKKPNCGTLNYETILHAAKFRKAPHEGILALDLSLDEHDILRRITGADHEKRRCFDVLVDNFREKLGDCFLA